MRDLVGLVQGKLTVVRFSHYDKHNKPYWVCKCACGNETHIVQGSNIVSGSVWHCGCERRGAGITNLKNTPPKPVVAIRGLSLDDIALDKRKIQPAATPAHVAPVPLPADVDEVHHNWKLHRRPSKESRTKVTREKKTAHTEPCK